MELGKQLDASGRAWRGRLICLLLLVLPARVPAQDSSAVTGQISSVKELYDAGQWEAVVEATPETSEEPAELELYRGLALARLERWADAQRAFEAGLARSPRDTRFFDELAGLAYREKELWRTERLLRRALRINPNDDYANDLLATSYFLEGNLEAALKYWNRVGKPRLSDLLFSPQPRVKPIILDRAFEFSRGAAWQRNQFLTTRALLGNLHIFSGMRFDLEAQPDDTFHLVFDSVEKGPWGSSKWEGLLSLLRGLPYQTVYPEIFNLNRSGLNWLSSLRWDREKRRVFSEVAAPLGDDPKWRYRIYFDARNENWNLTNTFLPSLPSPTGLNLEKATGGIELQSIVSGRWSWSAGLAYSYRTFRNLQGLPLQAGTFFTSGSSFSYQARVARSLVRFPERRFTLDSSATGEIGTFLSGPLGRYGRLEGDLQSTWLPQARGDDYEIQGRLRGGRTFGEVPFDEFFVLGFDRDTDLWMRGHPGLAGGEKGNAPLGRGYVLANWEVSKIVHSGPFVVLKVGPFVDTGQVYDSSGYFGSRKWLWDTGVQVKVRILGSFEFVVGYGKDLRSGNNSIFTTVTP